LKGAFYESEFSIESYFENRTREENDARASSEYRVIPTEHRELAQQLRTEFTELGGKRSTYNRERYQAIIGSQAEPSFSSDREQEFSQIFTATNGRNSNAFEPTGAAAPKPENTIRSIEQYEPRNSRNSQDQENPFYIKYGFSFDSSYFAYIEYLSRVRQQSKYNDIKNRWNKVIYLKQNGGSMNIQQCGDKKTARLCVQIDPEAPLYNNNFMIVQETN
jgi:hypothetical protein